MKGFATLYAREREREREIRWRVREKERERMSNEWKKIEKKSDKGLEAERER